MYKYMRDDLKDEYGLLKLQDKILEIAVYIDKFCQENDIDYCLMGGSALGVKRHGGFIPWDDDLDIFMTPQNYKKFKDNFLRKGNKDKFYLQEWGKQDEMITLAKVRMNNTTYIEELFENKDIHQGIFIDIFILHVAPNNKILQYIQYLFAKYLVVNELVNKGYSRAVGWKKFILKVGALLPKNFLVKFSLKQVYKYSNSETNYYCNFLGKALFKGGLYKKEWFTPTEYINFEKVKLKVPSNLELFLQKRFGDYMKIPSKERIKWEQHAKVWDTKKDFKKYLKNRIC